jgi:secreted PhoX family phosphatase
MKLRDADSPCNATTVPTIEELIDRRRRALLQAGAAGALLGALPLPALAAAKAGRAAHPAIGFAPIGIGTDDKVRVPAGYIAEAIYAWGDPVSAGPAFRADASNSAAEQALQAGMHHDGMHYFPLKGSSAHGLLCVNHEYTDDGLLHPGGMADWSAEKVAKSKAAHGISVVEVKREGERWQVVRPSKYARRITADTPIAVAGPAAGSPALRTAADPSGRQVLGTFNNCAMGVTPWGTYLTCEENFNGYFKAGPAQTPEQKRYGISAKTAGYRWHEHDERFDGERHPNEANRFGWVVEIDPYAPDSTPVKRTALGRFKHEGAFVTLAKDRRVVVYMGDDERFEYIYKFVSARPYEAGRAQGLLDEGTLYVARFDADGQGEWLPLVHGANGLTAENGFADQAEVLAKTRQAADRLKATPMDRPEWIAVRPGSKEVYCSLTNNTQRGKDGKPAADAANPRASNLYGHILRWREMGGDAAATRFGWDVFVQCGDPAQTEAGRKGDIQGDLFASPDGLWFDAGGRLWIQTDVSTSVLGNPEHAAFGNNQMLVADPATGAVRRFLTGPRGCEVTGITATPDGKTLFVNIQHPGETASERSDPANPTAVSAWPANQFPSLAGGRPRSATLAIRRADGGVVGA